MPVRILVVEDDFLVALELQHRLVEAGFSVIGAARTAEEAIEMAASLSPDVVIMDITLAGTRDGIDAAIEIRRSTGIRSIFVTAHGDSHTRTRGERANPLGWVSKPYSPQALVAFVKSTLKQDGRSP